jgi:DtxR family Mn-dependent transcriptional regulator
MKKIKVRPLTEAPLNKRLTILALANSTDIFLKYLDRLGLSIGEDIELIGVEGFDRSVMLIHKNKPLTLSSEAANNLLVKV